MLGLLHWQIKLMRCAAALNIGKLLPSLCNTGSRLRIKKQAMVQDSDLLKQEHVPSGKLT